MPGHQPSDDDRLTSIKRELACRGFRLSFKDQQLEQQYREQRVSRGRQHNNVAAFVTIIMFDVFILGEIPICPEVLDLAFLFRLGITTPACLLFLLLDGRRLLGSWSETALATLLYLPTLFGSLETFAVHHVEALPNFQALPLMQLSILTCGLSVRRAMYSVALACLTYITVTCCRELIPHAAIPSLVLTDLVIGFTVVTFSSRLDYRQRQVFLFELQSEIVRTMLAAQNATLSRLTRIDALTGISNRRCFDDTIESLWSPEQRERNQPVTLILFDIDLFKQFNDTLGHRAGDDCLRTLAHTVSECLGEDADKLARYGGEEFVIVLPATQLEAGRLVAERVRLAVQERAIPHPGNAPSGVVTVSLGVASVLPASQQAAAMIERADRCLYRAKRAGRNTVVADGPWAAPTLLHRLPQTLLVHPD